MDEKLAGRLRAYRRKKFRVTVERASYGDWKDEIRLSITHNGTQWSSINLAQHEIKSVILKLQGAQIK